jgi:hypothetical protein
VEWRKDLLGSGLEHPAGRRVGQVLRALGDGDVDSEHAAALVSGDCPEVTGIVDELPVLGEDIGLSSSTPRRGAWMS